MRSGKKHSFEDGLLAPGASVLVRIYMFSQWAKIGVEHYVRASAQPDPGLAFDDCLVAIVSAAFALDSFTRDLPHTRPSKVAKSTCSLGSTGEGHLAFEVLHANYDLTDAQRDKWHAIIHLLFELRSDAVHYRGELEPAFKHANGTFYHPLVGVYTLEVAGAALANVREILSHAIGNILPGNTELAELIERQLGRHITGFELLPVLLEE